MPLQDERTKRALRDLAEKQKAAIDAAEEICQCADCVQSRLKKEMSQCDKDRLLQYLPMKIFPRPYAGTNTNFIPELSPNYELWKSGKRRPF